MASSNISSRPSSSGSSVSQTVSATPSMDSSSQRSTPAAANNPIESSRSLISSTSLSPRSSSASGSTNPQLNAPKSKPALTAFKPPSKYRSQESEVNNSSTAVNSTTSTSSINGSPTRLSATKSSKNAIKSKPAVTAFKVPSKYRSGDVKITLQNSHMDSVSVINSRMRVENNNSTEEVAQLGLQTSYEASLGATGGIGYVEDHPPNPEPFSAAWNEDRRKGRIALQKSLAESYKKQVEARQKIKEKEAAALKVKHDALREETWKLINSGTGNSMRCPDCGEFKQRGGGMVSHRINWCKKRKEEIDTEVDASEETSQPKKRGRPTKSKSKDDVSVSTIDASVNEDETTLPKK